MIAVAVICFVTEARRKRVRESMGARVRRSRTPYPRAKTVRPLVRTSTARPGSPSATSPLRRADVTASRSMAGAAPAKRRRARASTDSSMPMRLGDPEAPRRLTLRVELDDHRRLAPHDPRIVARLDDEDARRAVLEPAAVRVFAADVALGEEAEVGMHAVGSADDGLHVRRPAEARRIDRALHAAVSGPDDIEGDAA